ncbi:hypothetical protein K438DRAFT_2145134 [Mycena galopus ATCC 62051]|nr:hypothetical protein K438DRAFT_2145134 [Mycena galopus ATCC 62051]
MRPFAQELVEQVIDCSTDSNAIKALGLVCKTWLPRTRYRLFSKVSLSHDNLSSFVDLVEASPLSLLSCIYNLTLCYNGAPPDTELLGRIRSCPNLRSISIQIRGSFEENQDAPDWLDSEESFLVHIHAWGRISSSISTLNLEVQGVDDIQLQTIVDIIRLSMHDDDETWEFMNADMGIPPSFPLALKELDLTIFYPFWNRCFPTPPNLKQFYLIVGSHLLAILRLLPSSGLHFIKFSFVPDEEVPWAEFDLTLAEPRFSALRGVSIYSYKRRSLITAEIKLLMPLASARKILE